MSRLFALIFVFFAVVAVSYAQTQPKPCSSDQAKQFDFWLGTWDLEWTDAKGQKLTGTNTINKILNDCVIEENFSTRGENPYLGKSHSLFDSKTGKWKQTWVDSGGSYLDFTGEFKNGKMTLSREMIDKEGKKIMQRMVFSDIRKDSLVWDWESSDDNGKTWKTNWKIFYKRRA